MGLVCKYQGNEIFSTQFPTSVFYSYLCIAFSFLFYLKKESFLNILNPFLIECTRKVTDLSSLAYYVCEGSEVWSNAQDLRWTLKVVP